MMALPLNYWVILGKLLSFMTLNFLICNEGLGRDYDDADAVVYELVFSHPLG